MYLVPVIPDTSQWITYKHQSGDIECKEEPKKTLVTAFANALYSDIDSLSRLSDAVPTVFRSLPALLQEFSMRSRPPTTNKMHTEAISFIQKNQQFNSTVAIYFSNIIKYLINPVD